MKAKALNSTGALAGPLSGSVPSPLFSFSSTPEPATDLLTHRLLPYLTSDPIESGKIARKALKPLMAHIQRVMIRGDFEVQAALFNYRYPIDDASTIQTYIQLVQLLAKVYRHQELRDLVSYPCDGDLSHEHWSAVTYLWLNQLLKEPTLDLKGAFTSRGSTSQAFQSALHCLEEFHSIDPSKAHLVLDECYLLPSEFDQLCHAIEKGWISELSMKNCHLQPAQASLLAEVCSDSFSIYSVDLSSNAIDQAAASQLVLAISKRPLSSLNLCDNPIHSVEQLMHDVDPLSCLKC